MYVGVSLIPRRIDLTEPTQYQGPRRLIKEGPVAKAKSGRQLSMVLCTDVIILIESRNLYRMVSGIVAELTQAYPTSRGDATTRPR